MKIHILTNALDHGDAVSTHCILLKQRAGELGIPAALCAEFAHEEVREHLTGPPQLLESAQPDDLLLHQLFNDTSLMPWVEHFPGKRLLASELSLRVGQDVVFTGKVPESHLVACYRTSDAFISMSEHEGFGAPLLESMAFGLPTIAYAAPACEETTGGAGVLFREKDFEAIAECVKGVLLNPARKEAVLACQRRRLEDFGPEKQQQSSPGDGEPRSGCFPVVVPWPWRKGTHRHGD